MMQLAVVILAAGASSRMGRPKLLLPWDGTTVLDHLVAQWREVGAAQVGVVCASGDGGLNDELKRIGIPVGQRIVNPEPARGMFSSIQCAARWTGWNATLTHWAIALGDQPHLSLETLRAIANFSALNPDCVCQPAFGGRPRHPVLLPRKMLEQLTGSTCATLKNFLAAGEMIRLWVELPDAGLDLDLDTPADYERAKRAFIG